MIRCREIGQLLYDYVEGLLEPSLKGKLDQHLSDCPGCTSFINTYKETTKLSKALKCEEIPPELQRKLRSFIKENLKKPSLWQRILESFR